MSARTPASTAASALQRAARGLRHVQASHTARYLFADADAASQQPSRTPAGWLQAQRRHTQQSARASTSSFRSACSRSVTGVSGSGKSSLVSQALVELLSAAASARPGTARGGGERGADRLSAACSPPPAASSAAPSTSGGWSRSTRSRSAARRARISRPTPGCSITCAAVRRDSGRAQAPLRCRPLFLQRRQGPLRHCEGEGFVSVELLFMPSVYAPCPTCHGTRYNDATLEIRIATKTLPKCWR